MPPRNSNTKAFRKYHYEKSPNAAVIPMEKIYDSILKPDTAINNVIERDFKAYKKRMEDQGIDLSKKLQSVIKDDEDGDPRYINAEWYKAKLRGNYNE